MLTQKPRSLISSMRSITVLPLLCFGLFMLLITSYTIYASIRAETKDGLNNLAHAFSNQCDQAGEGDYAMEDGQLTRGGKPFNNDFSLVDQIKEVSGVDATIFWGDMRTLTSIRLEDGRRAIGTRATSEVTKAVLEGGREFFSDQVEVNNIPYFGYYLPLKNSDQSIVGMLFVGKSRDLEMESVRKAMLLVVLTTVIAMIVVGVLTYTYARKIAEALRKTKVFLGKVAEGSDQAQLDDTILNRTDEIGEMGRFSLVLQKSVTSLVGTDTLTGLYNRRRGMQLLEESLRRYCQDFVPFTLAIGDIDNFKNINDLYGHLAGDAVLEKLSHVFVEHMGQGGSVIRWGGEEFLFIYEQMEKSDAISCLEALQRQMHSLKVCYEEREITVSMTFGVTEVTDNSTIEALLKTADKNLYLGKMNGKDCII